MIKILVLSRSDMAKWAKNIPQEDFDNYHESHLFGPTSVPELAEAHYALFQEGDGPVTIIKSRSDYPIEMLLQEIVDNLPKEEDRS